MMAVVLPALRASRTSIHVISSIQTLGLGGSGLGASAQLYGLFAQLPPPIDRGSCAGRPCGACAESAADSSTIPPTATIIRFVCAIVVGLRITSVMCARAALAV